MKKAVLHVRRKILLPLFLAILIFQGVYYGVHISIAKNVALARLEDALAIVADSIQARLLTNNIYREETLAQLNRYGVTDLQFLEEGISVSSLSEDEDLVVYHGRNVEITLTNTWLRTAQNEYIREQIFLLAQQSLLMLPFFLLVLLFLAANPLHRIYVAILASLENPSVDISTAEKRAPASMQTFFTSLKKLVTLWRKKTELFNSTIKKVDDNSKETKSVFDQCKTSEQKLRSLNEDLATSVDTTNAMMRRCHECYAPILEVVDTLRSYFSDQTAQVTTLLHTTKNNHETLLKVEDTLGKYWYHTDRFPKSLEGIIKMADLLMEAANQTYIVTDGMTETIDIIKNTANQMNILAMNTTIEAAHSGSSQQGLSVVANEIQNHAKIVFKNTNTLLSSAQKNKELFSTLNKKCQSLQEKCVELSALSKEFTPHIKKAFRYIEKDHSSLQAVQYAKDLQASLSEHNASLQTSDKAIEKAKKFHREILDPGSMLTQISKNLEKELFLIEERYEVIDRQFIAIKIIVEHLSNSPSQTEGNTLGEAPAQKPVHEQVAHSDDHAQSLKSAVRNPAIDKPPHYRSVDP